MQTKRIKIILAYDGTGYLGWQATNMGFSIEQSLKTILEKILQHSVCIEAASRTDAGVHAIGQVAVFTTYKHMINLNQLQTSLNQLLQGKICIREIQEVENSFHPTIDAKAKEYHYYLCLGKAQFPQYRFYSWHIPYLLDRKAMEEAAKQLIGKYDFSAFANVKKNECYQDMVREIFHIGFTDLDHERVRIEIKGDCFLYKMVRNIVGTLVYVGRGKIQPEEISEIIRSKNRKAAGVTAPACGLFLFEVYYEPSPLFKDFRKM